MLVPGPERAGRVKILDFGLAKVHRAVSSVADTQGAAETATVATARGLIIGTVNYMSPEQVEGEPADARSDLFALGLILYEMATGANPFVGKSPQSTIANILKQEAPPMAQRNPVVPAELDRIVRKCLRKSADERYQAARELRVDLANLRRDSAASAQPSTAATPPLREQATGTGVFPRGVARGLFMAIQAGYLALYAGVLYKFSEISRLLELSNGAS